MRLDFIPLDKLVVSKTNMRHGRQVPDVSDILPTVRKRGVIQPVLVRPQNGADTSTSDAPLIFEIIAGRRRFTAATLVAQERKAAGDTPLGTDESLDMLPCAILDAGDDAAAIEASMIENMARLDADEVTQWESFIRLVKQGQDVADIAATFGLPDLAVRRILALGNLLPRIRTLYRNEEIDRATVRHLTLASKAQQKAWLALADDPDAYCPVGHQLKSWLFGGQSIPVKHALFDIEAYNGLIVADLFGEDGYFADPDAFWAAQNAAIEGRRAAYLEAGWPEVVIVPASEHFATWEHEKAAKRKGGRVYADVRTNGEVTFHEGYISRKEALRAERLASGETGGNGGKIPRPEVSGPLQTYIDLHRHAAVRAGLIGHSGVALRLMVAHAIIGSPLWTVRREPQTSRNDATTESLENCRAEAVFDERRRAVLAVLDMPPDQPHLIGNWSGFGNGDEHDLSQLFLKLLELPETVILEIITVVMGETLAAGSAIIEAVGLHIGTDMADWWSADDAFFALNRDREVLGHLVAEVAGEAIAAANEAEKTKVLKSIITDHLTGDNGRDRQGRWVPRWMRFAPSAYTARGGVGTVTAFGRIMQADTTRVVPDPDDDLDAVADDDEDRLPRAA